MSKKERGIKRQHTDLLSILLPCRFGIDFCYGVLVTVFTSCAGPG